MLITSTQEGNGDWVISIQNESTGLFIKEAGSAQKVVNWLLEKAAEHTEIDDALEKTIETWRGNSQELFHAYIAATS